MEGGPLHFAYCHSVGYAVVARYDGSNANGIPDLLLSGT